MASTTIYSYVDPNIDQNLICCICRTPFTDPVTTQTCSHTFCQGCILQAISVSAQCPIDRSPLDLDFLAQADPIVRHLVDELIVECPNKDGGCPYTGQRQLVGSHVKNACGFVLVPCTGETCDSIVRRKDLGRGCPSAHDFSDEGPSTAPCKFCKEEILHSDFDKHMKSCSMATLPCTHGDDGCAWTGLRDALEAHVKACPYESIKGFFAINSKRFEALSEENEILRHQVDTLEGTLRTTQRELRHVKITLGPWFRPHSQQPTTSYHPSVPVPNADDDFDLAGFNFSSTTPASPPTAPYHLHPSLSGVSYNSSSATASIADYFPPEEPRARTRNSRSSSTSALSAFYPLDYNPPPTNNTPNISRSPIAPLDLSTTLEGSLSSLRESIVTLSAAVESQGRRHELALTTEGLRVNEEVGSLKAVIHGLRMQIHAIMMDRNAQVTGRFPFGGGNAGNANSNTGESVDEGWPPEGGPLSGPYFMPGGPQGWFPTPPPPLPVRFNQSSTSITKL